MNSSILVATAAPEVAAALEAVNRARSVQELCAALNVLKNLYPGDIDEIELPQFDDNLDVDWSNWAIEPLSADSKHVLLRGQDGRIFFMDRSDVEDGDEE